MKTRPRHVLIKLMPTAEFGTRPSRNLEVYCECGWWSEEGPWQFDPACPLCHGAGKYTLKLSRREHHVLLVEWSHHRRFLKQGGLGGVMRKLIRALKERRS